MSLLSQLERRFRRFAIPNLATLLVVGQACLYAAKLFDKNLATVRIQLDPAKVLSGEWWRLFTFLFDPPDPRTLGPIFAIFFFLLFHMFGTTLERHWGEFRFNVFILIGWIANVAAAFAASALLGSFDTNVEFVDRFASVTAPNRFLYSSLFLAFARLYPDFIINLFFVLPIRIKWLALLMWIGYGYGVIRGPWMARMLIIATVINYMIFFGPEHWRELRHGQRRRSFQTKAKNATAAPTHQCRICGVNSNDSPKTAFRYCSKCEGQACYCPEHIREHEHVTAEAAAK